MVAVSADRVISMLLSRRRLVVARRVRVVGVVIVAVVVVCVVVVVVVVIPHVHSVAAVLVRPFDLGLEVGPVGVLVALDCVIWVASAVAELPRVRIGRARVSVLVLFGRLG